jgi:hypothetical protein
MGKKSGSGSAKNNPDHTVFPRAQKPFFEVKILKLFDADPGWKKFGSRIRDEKPDSESGNIPDPQHCLAVSMHSVLV